MSNNKLTWADLKRIANEMPDELLKNEVYAWNANDATPQGLAISGIQKLSEDHVFDGDEGCAPLSTFKKDGEYDADWNYVVHPAGTIILIYTHEPATP